MTINLSLYKIDIIYNNPHFCHN